MITDNFSGQKGRKTKKNSNKLSSLFNSVTIQSTDVKHLRDENRVLREEIEQMTHEIDQLSYGRDGNNCYNYNCL